METSTARCQQTALQQRRVWRCELLEGCAHRAQSIGLRYLSEADGYNTFVLNSYPPRRSFEDRRGSAYAREPLTDPWRSYERMSLDKDEKPPTEPAARTPAQRHKARTDAAPKEALGAGPPPRTFKTRHNLQKGCNVRAHRTQPRQSDQPAAGEETRPITRPNLV